MKLNYKRTILVGFAFFLISAFWQAYDAIVPLILTNHYGLSHKWSGMVMSFDNVLAVFMLPIFGAISDKIMTKYGKRTPFIFIGTILAVLTFFSLTFVDNAQLSTVVSTEVKTEYAEAQKIDEQVLEYAFEAAQTGDDTLNEIANKQIEAVFALYGAKTIPEQYAAADTLRDSAYELMSEARKTKNTELISMAEDQLDTIEDLFEAIQKQTSKITAKNYISLIGFILLLLAVLISMAIFRSPAVALMPDVTIKPLRSKGNAIINLLGTAGGIIVLVFGIVFGTSKIYMEYTWYVFAVCAVMLAGLGIFIFTVKEKQWADEMQEETKRLGLDEPKVESNTSSRSLSKAEFKSLILILASVALWYIGYNSITSKYSVYATRELGFDYNLTLIIAQAAAVVSYIPVGIISSKFGRRKTILAGVVMLASAFFIANFITFSTPEFAMYPVFILAGIGWATINVNSFPMVVELAKGGEVGKYTGYYYTASMSAQIVAPILSGAIYKLAGYMVGADDVEGMRYTFFAFGTIFVALSFITMFFVKHGDSKPEAQGALESLAGADDD